MNPPEAYGVLPNDEKISRIQKHREDLGSKLCILGHHYQRAEIVALSDKVGDSFQLAREAAAEQDAENILFCGVDFMAEAAAILAREGQTVLHPDTDASCPMAHMANADHVEHAWEIVQNAGAGRTVLPVTYVNSGAELKAFCGRHGGIVCTSSNAGRVFDWAFERADMVMFFPDEHLGWNTARAYGVTPEETVRWDPWLEDGGVPEERLSKAKVFLWRGYCHVHTYFTVDHVRASRAKYPGATIIVHPECTADVVDEADLAGSTAAICRHVEQAGPGSVTGIGTEVNLVTRLAAEYPDRTVFPIAPSMCPNMHKVSLEDILWTLDELGKVNVVTVDPTTSHDARVALRRMLDVA